MVYAELLGSLSLCHLMCSASTMSCIFSPETISLRDNMASLSSSAISCKNSDFAETFSAKLHLMQKDTTS